MPIYLFLKGVQRFVQTLPRSSARNSTKLVNPELHIRCYPCSPICRPHSLMSILLYIMNTFSLMIEVLIIVQTCKFVVSRILKKMNSSVYQPDDYNSLKFIVFALDNKTYLISSLKNILSRPI